MGRLVPVVQENVIRPHGFMGVFGNGRFLAFTDPYYDEPKKFVVPAGVYKIRVRVVGAGGGSDRLKTGGAGGGYAHGVFNVMPGQEFDVIVGEAITAAAGGSSSFGTLISATGGAPGTVRNVHPVGPQPGEGFGGDFQAKGGSTRPRAVTGGGAAGSQLGDGGTAYMMGGAAVGMSSSYSMNGASPFGNGSGLEDRGGADALGATRVQIKDGYHNPRNAVVRFPFDGFEGAGGCTSSNGNEVVGGPGAGGAGVPASTNGGMGGWGGGGGASPTNRSGTSLVGGGAGTPSASAGSSTTQRGGHGLVVVEW